MKTKILLIVSIITLTFSLTACFNNKNDLSQAEFDKLSIEKKAEYTLNNMTLDEKIAQMLIVYYTGNSYDDILQKTIKEVRPGGFILMNENITTYEKTLSMVTGMQKDSSIPMIISIDQEGGTVQRLQKISDKEVSYIPSMYYVGKTNDTKLAYELGKIMANQLRTIGVNLDFAPVVDINNNPKNEVIGKRSFGNNANTVTDMALSLQKGLEENKINTCIKHFPGHGDTEVDSHYSLPIINKNYDELESLEFIPYKKAIEQNTNMIMIGHIALPQITGDKTPASLSKTIITDILKNKLGYKGLVVTDALNMGALTNNYTDKEIYTMAINAGVDLLLMPRGSKAAIKYIKESIGEGKITTSQIDNSVKKILIYKYKNIAENYLDQSYLNKAEYDDVLSKIKTK